MTKISLLPAATAVTGDEELPVLQDGETRRMSMPALAAAVAVGDAAPAIAAAIAAHEAEVDPHPGYATEADIAAVPEMARDAIAAALISSSGLTITPADGADTIDIKVKDYIWGFAMVGTATASEKLSIHAVGADFTIPADLAGGALEYTKGENPTAAAAITIERSTDGGASWSTAATISVSAAGVVTATTAGGVAIEFAKGDGLRPVAPASPDATFADWAFTIIGAR